jgi:hypothetical protein
LILRGEPTPRRVLFRALGPSLPNNNRPGALRNPSAGPARPNGELLASNDDWRDAPNAPEIEATGVAPNDDRESAILLTAAQFHHHRARRGWHDRDRPLQKLTTLIERLAPNSVRSTSAQRLALFTHDELRSSTVAFCFSALPARSF